MFRLLDILETTKVQFLGILPEDDAATVVVVVGATVVEVEDEEATVVVVVGAGAEGVVVTSARVIPVDQDTPLSVEYSKRVIEAPLVLPRMPDTVMSPLLLDAADRPGGVDTFPALI